ncbi:Helicase associated domain protein, partial [Streptomyces collinus]|uniref:helicase associated domain-containing protein n=1 Tax=Streptomyces collinus TaxID=42684 RepID=UPI0036E2F2BB
HHRVLTDLAADEPGGRLPDIAPGVLHDNDDLGRWLQRQKQPSTWKQLSGEQQERLTRLGVTPTEAPAAAPAEGATKGPGKAGSKTQQAFQRGLAALAQWVEREGHTRPVPRSTVIEITIDGEAEPVPVRLGVWISNTKQRRHKLGAEQLAALRELGMQWA